jgi:citrate synthase
MSGARRAPVPGGNHGWHKARRDRRRFQTPLVKARLHDRYGRRFASCRTRTAEKKSNANGDFYSASNYHTLGIDVDLFTPIFAVSRISGWAAHVIEQLDDNRLIRPRAEYVGPAHPQKYVAVEHQ